MTASTAYRAAYDRLRAVCVARGSTLLRVAKTREQGEPSECFMKVERCQYSPVPNFYAGAQKFGTGFLFGTRGGDQGRMSSPTGFDKSPGAGILLAASDG